MSRQLSKEAVESTRQPSLVSTKLAQKPIVSSFFQPAQQKPGYKFGYTSASKQTPFVDVESEKDHYKKSSQNASKNNGTVETAQVTFDEEEKEMTHQLETSTYLNIGEGLVNGFNKSKSQVGKSLNNIKSMPVVEQICRKQLVQHHLSVIEAMELLDLNEDPETVKQAVDQLFQQNIVRPPNEIEVLVQFSSAVSSGTGNDHDKNYWETIKKSASSLDKSSAADLDKLYDSIYQRKPCESGALVFILGARLKKPTNDHASATRLLHNFNFVAQSVSYDDLDHIHEKFCTVMTQFTNFLIEHDLAIHGLRILQCAIHHLAKGGKVITNLHARLFLLCLLCKRFDAARPFLDLDAGDCFLHSQQIYRVSCENALLYFYYGGLVKMALKDFHGAVLMFESCVCMPAISASTIMLEALKKLMLLNSILGRPQHLPSYRSPPVQRLAQSKCQKYHGIIQLFSEVTENKNKNPDATVGRLNELLRKNDAELNKDKNGGLAQELCWSAVRKNISKLPDVFSKLELAKVAKYCRIDSNAVCIPMELETFLQNEKVSGKIDTREGTVSFTPVQNLAEIDQEKLDEATATCSTLDDLLRNSHRAVDMHPTILARHFKKQNSQGLPTTVNFT